MSNTMVPRESVPRESVPRESEMSLAELRGDCARMAPHWVAHTRATTEPVEPSRIHGVTVPPSSARLVDSMSDYGD